MHDKNPIFSKLAIAPMIDWTNTHFRMLMRFLAPNALLYTEMQACEAVYHRPEQALLFHPNETPLALQLGGRDPKLLAIAAKKAEAKGFQEINLNLGCPSSRVQSGQFGACLMREPEQVAQCIKAMKNAVSIPVTAKTRIGVDTDDSYDFFKNFALMLVDSGIDKLIVHARKAWLNGLSPKQNRTIPPIQYDYVYQIKSDLKTMPVILNGEINTKAAVENHLKVIDGVMIGRLACNNPYAIAEIHHKLYPSVNKPTRASVLRQYFDYLQRLKIATSLSMHFLLKPVLNLSHGLIHARSFKQALLTLENTKDEVALSKLCKRLLEMENLDGFSA